MGKICSKCQKFKSLDEFYREMRRKDGHCALCKICEKKRTRNRKTYYNSEKYREINRRKQIKYKQTHPDKLLARKIARKVKLKAKCERCGDPNNLERHHPDYRKPSQVKTVCRCCHLSLHK